MKQFLRGLAAWSPILVVAIGLAPMWIFFARLWWEWTTDLITKPWDQILCIGSGCS